MPMPTPNSIAPKSTLIVASGTKGGCVVKYPSMLPINSDSTVAPNIVRTTKPLPKYLKPPSNNNILVPYIVTATGKKPDVA